MLKKLTYITLILTITSFSARAQSQIVKDFQPVCDSLSRLIEERNTIKWKLELKSVMKRKGALDFYFTESLGDYPWKQNDIKWFEKELVKNFPEAYKNYKLGSIFSKKVSLPRLETPELSYDGQPKLSKYKISDPRNKVAPIVKQVGEKEFKKGLSGRNLALWNSHGLYYEQKKEKWQWQRPTLFQTVEDLLTTGFILDYVVPMLENAGAYTFLPRERDTQIEELIVDNDPYNSGDSPRRHGNYKEIGSWQKVDVGFADSKPYYENEDLPFRMGTSRTANTIAHNKKDGLATVTWAPDINQAGEYAVYISYQSLPKSTSSALYKVRHDGGETEFIVNQQIGGGMWIYLGTFHFSPETEAYVKLENRTPKGYKFDSDKVVSADAVKFGGGMGNVARKHWEDSLYLPEASGLPRYTEGARYWLQWAGMDTSVFSQNELKDDYRDDLMSRGAWVSNLSAGSYVNPKQKNGKNIPIDLSLAMHTDAGITPNDSTIGTLIIYTRLCENSQKLPNGEDRLGAREFSDIIQTQIVEDLRAEFDPIWRRRAIWDRSYSESRTTSVPATLLELLSHQNFADMRYALDPDFKFTAARAIYKGILKYLSNRYSTPYVVQPLPVHNMAVNFNEDGTKARISWRATKDELEPTAISKGFILQSKVDDGTFDKGIDLKNVLKKGEEYSVEIGIETDKIFSFRIIAFNDGGYGFPSEVVSIGKPSKEIGGNVLIVNNFNRVAPPAWFDSPSIAGFNNRLDHGVPYMRDISYTGDMYEFRRDAEFFSNENGGFGASYKGEAGKVVAGNTFDYARIHGEAIMKAGHAFTSTSASAFSATFTSAYTATFDSNDVPDSTISHPYSNIWAIDLICGKQVTSISGHGAKGTKYTVFTPELQTALSSMSKLGKNILVSGAYIGTDIYDSIYPIKKDSLFTAQSKTFAEKILGYVWAGNRASQNGNVYALRKEEHIKDSLSFFNSPNPLIYCVESVDAIQPSSDNAWEFLRYSDTGMTAGVKYQGKKHKVVSIGFPIEIVMEKSDIDAIFESTFEFFKQ